MRSLLVKTAFGERVAGILLYKVAKGRLKMGFRRPLVWVGREVDQAYTAFIYNGPAWPGRINRALATGSAARVVR